MFCTKFCLKHSTAAYIFCHLDRLAIAEPLQGIFHKVNSYIWHLATAKV